MELVGRAVKKTFEGLGTFSGIVDSYDPLSGLFKVLYEDGDSEDLGLEEVVSVLLEAEGSPLQIVERKSGREPKERISGNSRDIEMNECSLGSVSGVSLLETLAVSFEGRRTQPAGNDVVCEIRSSVFDLQGDSSLKGNSILLAFVDTETQGSGILRETTSFGAMDDAQEKETGCGADSKGNDPSQFAVTTQTRKCNFDAVSSVNCYSSGSVNVAQMEGSGDGAYSIMDSCVNLEEECPSEVAREFRHDGGQSDGELKSSSHVIVENKRKEHNNFDEHFMENNCFGSIEDGKIKNNESVLFQVKEIVSDAILPTSPEIDFGNISPDVVENNFRRRKRRKLSGNLNPTPERVLRRSARRINASLSSPKDTQNLDAIKNVMDEKCPVSESRKIEVRNHHFLKPELPPSSNDLKIDELPIIDLFSVYACLRSFSTVLFLSPFALDVFVAVLKCSYANSLLDSIHFSILSALKKHLEYLSNEGSRPATDCLRSLNWELLDLITWPVYLAEYLLINGSGLTPKFNLCHLKLLEGEYYRQTAAVKLEILRCLCDDVVEVESIRLEINRRLMASELDIGADFMLHSMSNSKRKEFMEDFGNSGLTSDFDGINADPNSDECCLCRMDGSLICCDGCPAAYHSRCVGISKNLLPEGDWYCPECMADKHKGQMNFSKHIRGAQLLGVDPHGRLYFGCCGYLLVLDSSISEPSHYYYSRSTLTNVIEVLKSSLPAYSDIVAAISSFGGTIPHTSAFVNGYKTHVAHMDADTDVASEKHNSDLPGLASINSVQCSSSAINSNRKEPKHDLSTHEGSSFKTCIGLASPAGVGPLTINQDMDMCNPFLSSDRSVMSAAAACIPMSEKIHNRLEIAERLNSSCEEFCVKPADADSSQGNYIDSSLCAPLPSKTKQDLSHLGIDPDCYINHYSHGQVASSVIEELTCMSSENTKKDSIRTSEEVISTQVKAISRKSRNFSWIGIQKLYMETEKESCGWCFSCKFPSDKDCLFRLTDEKIAEDSKISAVLSSNKSRKTHLSSVAYCMLSFEDRLRGLLSGPWENSHHSRKWRRSIINALDVSTLKPLLIMFESNLRRVALSAEWVKQMDSSVALGSGSHVFTRAIHGPSKHGLGKKRSRKNSSDAETSILSNSSATSGIYWWRGGRLSRKVFQWKLLPRPLAFKCGRQAGCSKVPGVSYPDGSEFSNISKYIAWRASVQMSTSVAQLAVHVRDLDCNIRWSDLGNPHMLHCISNETKKMMRLFKKVVVRRKCIDGSNIKYLLDFGKRKVIPDTVVKNGVVFEESVNDRQRFWLGESFVPLNLLKSYEEKKQARIASKTDSKLLLVGEGKTKRSHRKEGLSYLFSRAENQEHQCGHCKKLVADRESVNCQFCRGLFHRNHARVSKGPKTEEHTYACFSCRKIKVKVKAKKPVKVKPKRKSQKLQLEDSKIPKLRRSQRAIKKVTTYVPIQSKKLEKGHKRGSKFQSDSGVPKKFKLSSKSQKSKKSKFHAKRGTSKISQDQARRELHLELNKGITWCKGKRTFVYHAYWLNGIQWTKNPYEQNGIQFRDRNVLLPSMKSENKQPICFLCRQVYNPGLIYVRCEPCQEWFHGDAFGLGMEKNGQILGFRCPNCLGRSMPFCPHFKDDAVPKAKHPREANSGMNS